MAKDQSNENIPQELAEIIKGHDKIRELLSNNNDQNRGEFDKSINDFYKDFKNVFSLFINKKSDHIDIKGLNPFLDNLYDINSIIQVPGNEEKLLGALDKFMLIDDDAKYFAKQIFVRVLSNGKKKFSDIFDEDIDLQILKKLFDFFDAENDIFRITIDENDNYKNSMIYPTYRGVTYLYLICKSLDKFELNLIEKELSEKTPICCPLIGYEIRENENLNVKGKILCISAKSNIYNLPGFLYPSNFKMDELELEITKIIEKINKIFLFDLEPSTEKKFNYEFDCIIPRDVDTYRTVHVYRLVEEEERFSEELNKRIWRLIRESPTEVSDSLFLSYSDIIQNKFACDGQMKIGEKTKCYIMYRHLKFIIENASDEKIKDEKIKETIREWKKKELKIDNLIKLLESNTREYYSDLQLSKKVVLTNDDVKTIRDIDKDIDESTNITGRTV